MYLVGEAVGKQHFHTLAGAQIVPVAVTWQLTIKHADVFYHLTQQLHFCVQTVD